MTYAEIREEMRAARAGLRTTEQMDALLRVMAENGWGKRGQRWDAEDHRIAALQVYAAKYGEALPDDAHPLAHQMLEKRDDWWSIDLARRVLAARLGAVVDDWNDLQVLASGTEILGSLYESNAHRRVLARMPRLLAKIRAFCQETENPNYMPASVGSFSLTDGIAVSSEGARPWQTLQLQGDAESVALRSSPVRLRFTQQIILNDDSGYISAMIDAVLIAAAQNELREAFSALTDNANLSDGEPLFGLANTVTVDTSATSAIDSAVAKLRGQELNGAPVDVDPHALIVPAVDEATARKLVSELDPGQPWIDVVGTSYLPEDAWYLFADPEMMPVVQRVLLKGSNGQSLKFDPVGPKPEESGADIILGGMHTYRYQPVSRLGAVRIDFS